MKKILLLAIGVAMGIPCAMAFTTAAAGHERPPSLNNAEVGCNIILKTIHYFDRYGFVDFQTKQGRGAGGTYIVARNPQGAGQTLTTALINDAKCPEPIVFISPAVFADADYHSQAARSRTGAYIADASGRPRYVQNDRQYLALPIRNEAELRSRIFTQ